MIRQYFPVKDATVYSEFVTRNAGMDEILEVGKTELGNYSIRSIIDFNFPAIVAASPTGSVYVLRLQTANATRLPANQSIWASVYTGSWAEGTGYYYQDIYQVPNGVVWTDLTGAFSPSVTGTITRPVANELQINITGLVTASNITGLILQFPASDEVDNDNKGIIKFFSRDTHTIYSPVLEVRWQDQIYATGSLSSSNGLNLVVLPSSLKEVYRVGETAKVSLTVREKYPQKTFANSFNPYATALYVPPTTYFSIVDEQANFPVIQFSDYTKVHQTATDTYIQFAVTNMYPRRFYKIVLKMVFSDGTVQYFDDGYVFKVSE
jgi:hypothetical protein